MELRNLATFLKVAELENITRAAAQLGYAQSTVTTQIQQLEAEIGKPLFDRVGKKVTLTGAGQELIPLADRMLQLSQQALALGLPPQQISGRLRLGVVESLCVWEVCGLLPEYHRRYPRVSLSLDVDSGWVLIERLRRNELDMVFFLDRNLLEPEFVRALARPAKLVFVANANHPLAKRHPVSLADIAAAPLVLTERHGIYSKVLEDVLLSRGLEYEPVLEANNTDLLVRLLRREMGISFLPEYVVRDSVAKGQLAILDVEEYDVEFFSQLFYHKNKWLTPQMEGFIQLLQEHYESQDAAAQMQD